MANRHAQGTTERFENCLRHVVRINAAQIVDVQRYRRRIDEALKKLMDQIDIEIADPRAWIANVIVEPRTT